MIKKPKRPKKRRRMTKSKLSMEERQALIISVLTIAARGASRDERIALGNFMADLGIDTLCHFWGLKQDSAMILFPEDSLVQLIAALETHAETTRTSTDDTISWLISRLSEAPTAVLEVN